MPRFLLPLALSLALALPAAASPLRVVSSIETLGSLAREVGGDRIRVESLSHGYQDPHFVEAKPSLMLTLNRADLLLHVGLELEVGWLPPLVIGSRNAKIQPGEPGNLDCSEAIPLLDVPVTKVDRSMGDVHPMGNPHYWLPPENAKRIARLVATRLEQLDPEGRDAYESHLAAFVARADAKAKQWAARLAHLRGANVATYHKSWSYVSQWLGLAEVGYVEPKPGIPPDPAHLAQLIGVMRKSGARLLFVESFYNRATAQLVADKAGSRLVVLPTDVGATGEIKTWFELIDELVRQLSAMPA